MKNKQVKNWTEIKSNDSWALFKIMSEFVEGYETLARIGPCISVFGSARTQEGHPHYDLAVEVAERIDRPADGHNPTHGGECRLDRLRCLLCRKLAGFTSEDFVQDVEPTDHADDKPEPHIHVASFTRITANQHNQCTDRQTPENARRDIRDGAQDQIEFDHEKRHGDQPVNVTINCGT